MDLFGAFPMKIFGAFKDQIENVKDAGEETIRVFKEKMNEEL